MSNHKDSGNQTHMEEDKQHQLKISMVGTSKLLSNNSTSSISKRHSHHSIHNSSNPWHQANNVKHSSRITQVARPITKVDKTKTTPNTAKHLINNNRISIKIKRRRSLPSRQGQEKKE